MELKVEPSVLRSHAAKVSEIMCSFMVPPLSAVKGVADLVIDSAAGAIEKTVGDLKDVADSYEDTDVANSKALNDITALLGGQ